MDDIQKRLEKAEKYLQKGKQEDALEEYLSILEDDPNNDAVRQSAADILLSLDRNDEAMELLSTLFDRQAAVGKEGGGPIDLRTAALLVAIERVARVALERGIWP